MAFTDRLRKRISSPVGYAGGTLEEQLQRAGNMDAQGGIWEGGVPQPEQGGFIRDKQPTMAESAIARADEPQTRPRTSFKDALQQQMVTPQPEAPTGGLGPSVRARRTEPRDFIADDEAYLRDLRNKPRTWRDKLVDVTDAINAVAGGQKRIIPTKREREIGEVENRIGQGLAIDRTRIPRASERGQISTRVVNEGEYPDVEAGTEIRVRIDPRTGEPTDMIGANKRPVVAGLPKKGAERAPHYEKDAEGYLITVQEGRAKRVTDEKGEPVQVKKSGDEEFVEVEINGRKLKVTPAQALNYYGQIGEQEIKRTAEQREVDAKRNAALKRAADFKSFGEIYDNNADEAQKELNRLQSAEGGAFPSQVSALQAKITRLRQKAEDSRADALKARSDAESLPPAEQTPTATTKKLDPAVEKKIRDAASAKGLDPNIAVQRALERQ